MAKIGLFFFVFHKKVHIRWGAPITAPPGLLPGPAKGWAEGQAEGLALKKKEIGRGGS